MSAAPAIEPRAPRALRAGPTSRTLPVRVAAPLASLPTMSVAVFLASLLTGCQAQRALRITSDPSQAEVRLDGVRVGTTPCEVPFEHYGVRRVTLYLSGYRTYSRSVEVSPPWYGQFPFDIFSEVILPLGWSDTHSIHVQLVAGQGVLLEPDLPSVLERAETLRHAGPEGPTTDEKGKEPGPR